MCLYRVFSVFYMGYMLVIIKEEEHECTTIAYLENVVQLFNMRNLKQSKETNLECNVIM